MIHKSIVKLIIANLSDFKNLCYNTSFFRGGKVQKRIQAVLPDWLEEYIIFIADKYDISVSEAIRSQICLAIISLVNEVYTEYESEFSAKDIYQSVNQFDSDNIDREKFLKLLSKTYFEARKAVEFRLKKEREPKKPSK